MTVHRYSRQILFRPIGAEGQRRIRQARLSLIGCGALGSVCAEMLVRAGVGRLVLADRDLVEESNLQRQTLFAEADARAALPKAVAAERALRAINSDVEIEGRILDVTPENIDPLCRDADVIVDGTDNFETRYLINDFAFEHSIPWIYGGCVGSYGVAFAFQPGRTACLQCLFPDPPALGTLETCDTSGIVAPVVHMVAAYQVSQVLKILVGESLNAHIFYADAWEDRRRFVPADTAPDPRCRCCRLGDFRFLRAEGQDRTVRLCGRDAVQVLPADRKKIDFDTIRRRLQKSGRVQVNPYMMRIDIEGYEIALFPDGRSIIKGTDDPVRARSVYAKYLGR